MIVQLIRPGNDKGDWTLWAGETRRALHPFASGRTGSARTASDDRFIVREAIAALRRAIENSQRKSAFGAPTKFGGAIIVLTKEEEGVVISLLKTIEAME